MRFLGAAGDYMLPVIGHRDRPAKRCVGGAAGIGRITGHFDGAQLVRLADRKKGPVVRVLVGAVQDGLKMKVAAGGRSGRPHPGNDLADPHRVAFLDGDRLKVVVGGDESVAVVDFHTVSATPRVPADCPHDSGVGSIDPGAAGRGIVLAPVEFAGGPGDGAGPQSEGRGLLDEFQGCHEEAFCRPLQSGRCHIEFPGDAVLGGRFDR
ncbi:hypothetical protein BJQ90_00691 [Arthrobacter sp. SO3]|nr:hypothetical protein [Arthrobacter sp. SO3]